MEPLTQELLDKYEKLILRTSPINFGGIPIRFSECLPKENIYIVVNDRPTVIEFVKLANENMELRKHIEELEQQIKEINK